MSEEVHRGEISGVSSVMRAMARVAFRKSFNNDPIGTIHRAGMDLKKIPSEMLDTLAELSAEELEIFTRVAARLREINGGRGVSV
jgi:hypothetical protein